MQQDGVIVRFNKVSFEYGHNKPILNEADFSIRRGAKIALMGQNGAGKSTIFQLITPAGQAKTLHPESGIISVENGLTVATARQVIPRDQMQLTVQEFFEQCFDKKIYDIDPRIDAARDLTKKQEGCSCSLPLDIADRINKSLQNDKDECFKKYPQK